jgi:hypothetical protein
MSVADTEGGSDTHYADPDNGNTDSVQNFGYLHFTHGRQPEERNCSILMELL